MDTTTTTTTGQFILPSTTTTTSTTTISTTTTTTTTGIPVQPILIAKTVSGYIGGLCGAVYNDANATSLTYLYFQSIDTVPAMGEQLYTNAACTIPFVGDDAEWAGIILWEAGGVYNCIVTINIAGEVTNILSCSSTTTTTTSTVSPPIYHVEMSVNNTTYDTLNEENIPYILAPLLIHTPTKVGNNYLFFSIPIAKSFIIKDSIGFDVTTDFSIDTASGIGGVDIRTGYYNNYLYRSNNIYTSSFSLDFTLILS